MTLAEERELLIRYAGLKLERRDWHGLADVAMDLREVEARLEAIPLPTSRPPTEAGPWRNMPYKDVVSNSKVGVSFSQPHDYAPYHDHMR